MPFLTVSDAVFPLNKPRGSKSVRLATNGAFLAPRPGRKLDLIKVDKSIVRFLSDPSTGITARKYDIDGPFANGSSGRGAVQRQKKKKKELWIFAGQKRECTIWTALFPAVLYLRGLFRAAENRGRTGQRSIADSISVVFTNGNREARARDFQACK